MPTVTNSPFLLNPAARPATTLNSKASFEWFTWLGRALRTSPAMVDLQNDRELSERLFVVQEDGSVKTFQNNADANARLKMYQELYTAAMKGRLMCYPIGQDRPVQVQTDGKREFSLSAPWQEPQLQALPKPKSMGFFKTLLYNLFGWFSEDKAALENQKKAYDAREIEIATAGLLQQGVENMLPNRQKADLEAEKAQIPQLQAKQPELEKAYQAMGKVADISEVFSVWLGVQKVMRPGYTLKEGDKYIVRPVDGDIYAGTEEYRRREKAELDAEKAGTQVDPELGLSKDWYEEYYLNLKSHNIALLSTLACCTVDMKQPNDPLWQQDPEKYNLQKFDELLDNFLKGEKAEYTDTQRVQMLQAKNKVVHAINRQAGNTVNDPDDRQMGELLVEGLKRMCRMTLKTSEFNEKEAFKLTMIRETLNLLDSSKQLMDAAKRCGLQEGVLEEARGLVEMGKIMTNGYQARAELQIAVAENTPVKNMQDLVTKIQAMRIVQEDIYRLKTRNDEVDSSIAEALEVDDRELAKTIEQDREYATELQTMLGKSTRTNVLNIYKALKENPNNQELAKLPAKDVLNQLKSPVADGLMEKQLMSAIQVDEPEQPAMTQQNTQEMEAPKFDESDLNETLFIGF